MCTLYYKHKIKRVIFCRHDSSSRGSPFDCLLRTLLPPVIEEKSPCLGFRRNFPPKYVFFFSVYMLRRRALFLPGYHRCAHERRVPWPTSWTGLSCLSWFCTDVNSIIIIIATLVLPATQVSSFRSFPFSSFTVFPRSLFAQSVCP